jgi:Na+/H+-dicarboxylate symporter/ABC-type amino acid transport substrate-binding protein
MEKTSAGTSPATIYPWPVTLGGLLGILTGLFLGDYAHFLHPIGRVYVLMLEVAVYPYLICSLLHGLGSMTPPQALKLFKSGWKFYTALWIVTFAVLIFLSLGIPHALPTSLEPPPVGQREADLLALLIPSDFFAALSKNYVPAVVLFCFLFGIALQHVPEKKALLSTIESIRVAGLKFWNAVVRFAPVAVFALFADLFGTMRLRGLEEVALFIFLFIVGCLALAFWILPACISVFAPLNHADILRDLRSAFLIVVATSLSVSALPYICSATERLAAAGGVEDSDTGNIVQTNISVAYPLGQLGNYFVYLFIVFALFHFGVVPDAGQTALLPLVTLLSCVGSPTSTVNAVAFLANWLGLPSQTTELYVSLMTLTRYGQVLVSVTGFAFLNFGVVLAYYGKVRIRLRRLFVVLFLPTIFLALCVVLARSFDAWMLGHSPDPYLSLSLEPAVTEGVSVSVDPPAPAEPLQPGSKVLARIQRTGELRVGYNDGIIPFCYRNSANRLAGYDVAYAYQLARDLNVRLSFIPFQWQHLASDLEAGRFDIAMAGIYVTADRLLRLKVSIPYFQSPLAFFMPRDRASAFRSRSEILKRRALRIGIFDDPILMPRLKRTFPNAELVIVSGYSKIPDFSRVDAALWTLVQARALAAANPDLIAVAPSGVGTPYLFAYFMPPDAQEFTAFVNYWLALKKADGFEQRQREYWIDRLPRENAAPRWSVLRDVLGFGLNREKGERVSPRAE